MKKFVMVLSILCMGGAAFLGVMNRQTLIDEQAMLAKAKDDIKVTTGKLRETEELLAQTKERRDAARNERDMVSAKLEAEKLKQKQQESMLMTMKGQIEKSEVEIKEIDLVIKSAGADTFEELEMMRQRLRDDVASNTKERDDASMKHDAKMNEVAAVEGNLLNLREQRLELAKRVALNGLEATVIAVNRNWGFVMVNVGSTLGVRSDAALLVKRGDERIARLRISEISDEVLVAEVIEDSVAEGVYPAPGDRVIFENSQQQ